ncbi:MAG: slipin family protein [Acidobacteriota bacterium]|nr:slipin family protein [Blastocatellia bacterium]MDW8412512.1 slipin family protein [Acidobacteriota bacterium]
MEYLILAISAIFILIPAFRRIQRCTIFEYQRGLLYRRGKFISVLQPGVYYLFRPINTLTLIDIRTTNMTISGQEVLSADNVGLKISLVASYKVSDPYLAVNKVFNYQEALYLLLQLNLREIVSSLAVDEILAKREEIKNQLYEKSKNPAAEIGLELLSVNIKDLIFPGDLKNTFAQVVKARKEGLAALEKARGESAALRNLANAARMLDNNSNLFQLRLLHAIEHNSGNTLIILPPEAKLTTSRQTVNKLPNEPPEKEDTPESHK